MRIQVREFKGMMPQRSVDLMPAGVAQNASNVRLESGELRTTSPINTITALSNLGTPTKSIYRFGQSLASTTQYWFQSASDVDYAKGPIDNDTVERTYFTDYNGTTGFPKKTDSTLALGAPPYPTASYAMGVPAPATAPSVSVTGVATNPADPAEAVALVLTYVSSWGEEGAQSPASAIVSWRPGQTLSITGMAVAPGAGAHGENYNITGKRAYRSATGTSATQYQLDTSLGTAGTIPIATTTGSSTLATSGLGDTLPSVGFAEPPFNMIGLRPGPNGMMAAFVGNTLYLCEPNLPYAWPTRYQQSTDAPIVGIEWFDQSLFIGTTQGIYVGTGVDPANFTLTKLPVAQSLASKRSVVAMNGSVFFAAPDGLYSIDGNGIKALTEGLMLRSTWQSYVPSSISAYESDNRYIAFYDTGSVQGNLVFTFGSVPSFSVGTQTCTAGYRDKKADKLFIIQSSFSLKEYEGTTTDSLTLVWASGVFHLPSDVNMAAAAVDAANYSSLTFKLYADGALKHTQTVTSKAAFRLPGGYRSSRYYFEITHTGGAITNAIRDVQIAETMQEIAKDKDG